MTTTFRDRSSGLPPSTSLPPLPPSPLENLYNENLTNSFLIASSSSPRTTPSIHDLKATTAANANNNGKKLLSASLMPHQSYSGKGMAFTTYDDINSVTSTTASGPRIAQLPKTSSIHLSPLNSYFPLESTNITPPVITTNIVVNRSGSISVKSDKTAMTTATSTSRSHSLSSRPKNKKKLGIIPPSPSFISRTPTSSPTQLPLSATSPTSTISSWRPHTPPPIPPPPPANSTPFTTVNASKNSSNSSLVEQMLSPGHQIQKTSQGESSDLFRTHTNTTQHLSPVTTSTSKFLSNLTITPSSNKEALKSVDIHARFYQEKDIQYKLHLLMSPNKLDEVLEFGFPIELSKEDLIQLSEDDYLETSGDLPPPKRNFSGASESSSSSWRPSISSASSRQRDVSPIPPLPPLTMVDNASANGSGKISFDNSSTSPTFHPTLSHPYQDREMTLKITLTPASMRADEETIYGWQRDHIDSGTIKSVKSLASGADIDDEYDPPLIPPMTPTTLGNYTNPSSPEGGPPIKPYASASTTINQESSFIPAGGLGGEVSSKKIVKRVFGKFRRQKTTNTALMITSSDKY